MNSMLLVTGGSGSGKSDWAEMRALQMGYRPMVYLATMRPQGDEAFERIRRHRMMRAGKGFQTVERYSDLADLCLPAELRGGAVLLEDLSNLLANEMFGAHQPAGCNALDCAGEILRGLQGLRGQCAGLIVVTNEIFQDGVRYDPATTAYIQTLALLNREAADMADEVAEVVCGLPLILKEGDTVQLS